MIERRKTISGRPTEPPFRADVFFFSVYSRTIWTLADDEANACDGWTFEATNVINNGRRAINKLTNRNIHATPHCLIIFDANSECERSAHQYDDFIVATKSEMSNTKNTLI